MYDVPASSLYKPRWLPQCGELPKRTNMSCEARSRVGFLSVFEDMIEWYDSSGEERQSCLRSNQGKATREMIVHHFSADGVGDRESHFR